MLSLKPSVPLAVFSPISSLVHRRRRVSTNSYPVRDMLLFRIQGDAPTIKLAAQTAQETWQRPARAHQHCPKCESLAEQEPSLCFYFDDGCESGIRGRTTRSRRHSLETNQFRF